MHPNHQVFLLYIQMNFERIFQNGSTVKLAIKDPFHHTNNRLVDYQLLL